MYVDRIYEDTWDGSVDRGQARACQSTEQVALAVKRLDGRQRTQVGLESSSGPKVMCISAGNDGRYVVFVAVNVDEEFYNLIAGIGESAVEVDVVTGGQMGCYPARQVVGLQAALDCAQYFAACGELDPRHTWEKQK